MTRTIFAIGGGAFDSDQPHRSALDRYVLNLAAKPNPNVCLIPTATGDSLLRIARFNKAVESLECKPSLCELFRPPSADLEDYLLNQDVIYVSGGSTFNMLVLWRAWRLDEILYKAWEQGIPLAGTSAGANCWFERCSTDSFFGELSVTPGMGWLPFDFCPHYNEEESRQPTLRRMIDAGEMNRTLACDGGAGCHFEGLNLKQVVSTDPGATAYWVDKDGFHEQIPNVVID